MYAGSFPPLDGKQTEYAISTFRVMSNESRFLVLVYLTQGQKTVSDLAQLIGVSQPHLSQQLTRLRAERMVKSRKEGTRTYYSLFDDTVARIIYSICVAYYGPDFPAPV